MSSVVEVFKGRQAKFSCYGLCLILAGNFSTRKLRDKVLEELCSFVECQGYRCANNILT